MMSKNDNNVEIVLSFIVLAFFGIVCAIPTSIFDVIDMAAEQIDEDNIPKAEGKWGELQEKQISDGILLYKIVKFFASIIGLLAFFIAVRGIINIIIH